MLGDALAQSFVRLDELTLVIKPQHYESVMRTLREVKFSGSVVPDHVPELAGDKGIRPRGTAYCIAAMRAMLGRAKREPWNTL